MEHPWSTALVTGASSGIGESFSTLLAEGGVDVVLVARRADRLETLATTLRSHGVTVEVLAADLGEAAGRDLVAQRLADRERVIDLLVNCAGIGAATGFGDGDLERYRQIIDVNIGAVVDLTHAAIKPMAKRRKGWIINVSSLGGHAPGPGFAVYSASKAFVTSLSESLHEEYRTKGVVITAVCPGATRTEFGADTGAIDQDLPSVLWQEAAEVAQEGLTAAAAGRAVRVTGWPNRLAANFTALVPRLVRRRVAGMVTAKLSS